MPAQAECIRDSPVSVPRFPADPRPRPRDLLLDRRLGLLDRRLLLGPRRFLFDHGWLLGCGWLLDRRRNHCRRRYHRRRLLLACDRSLPTPAGTALPGPRRTAAASVRLGRDSRRCELRRRRSGRGGGGCRLCCRAGRFGCRRRFAVGPAGRQLRSAQLAAITTERFKDRLLRSSIYRSNGTYGPFGTFWRFCEESSPFRHERRLSSARFCAPHAWPRHCGPSTAASAAPSPAGPPDRGRPGWPSLDDAAVFDAQPVRLVDRQRSPRGREHLIDRSLFVVDDEGSDVPALHDRVDDGEVALDDDILDVEPQLGERGAQPHRGSVERVGSTPSRPRGFRRALPVECVRVDDGIEIGAASVRHDLHRANGEGFHCPTGPVPPCSRCTPQQSVGTLSIRPPSTGSQRPDAGPFGTGFARASAKPPSTAVPSGR